MFRDLQDMCEWLEKLFIGQEKNKEELKNVDAKSLFHILHNQPILYKNKVSYTVLSQNIKIYNGCSKGTLKYCVGHLCLVHVTICYQPWIIWPMVYGSLILFQGQSHLKLSPTSILRPSEVFKPFPLLMKQERNQNLALWERWWP